MTGAKKLLSGVRYLDVKIRNKLIERQQWKDRAGRISASMDGDRVSASGGKSKMADAVDVCIDAEAEIYEAVCELKEAEKTAVGLIERLESPVQYDVLHMKYVQGIPLQGIADQYGRGIEWAKKTHKRAVENAQELMNKK